MSEVAAINKKDDAILRRAWPHSIVTDFDTIAISVENTTAELDAEGIVEHHRNSIARHAIFLLIKT
jgi:hypothetical protein